MSLQLTENMSLQLTDLTALDLVNMLTSGQKSELAKMLDWNTDELMGCSDEATDYVNWVASLVRKEVG